MEPLEEISRTLIETDNSNSLSFSLSNFTKTLLQTEDSHAFFSSSSKSNSRNVPLNLPILQNVDLSHATLINESKMDKISHEYGIAKEIPLKSANSESFNFEIIEFLGSGSHGKAFHAIDGINNRDVALKFLEFQSFSDRNYLDSIRELIVLQILSKSPQTADFFLNLFEFYLDDSEKDQGKLFLVIVLEFSLLDLSELLSLRQEINEKFEDCEILYILSNLLEGLFELKRLGIAHRDIKLDNLFLTKGFKVKIGDLSEAKVFERHIMNNNGLKTCSVKGTPFYMSPELLDAYQTHTPKLSYDPWKSDMYSMALTLYQLKSFNRFCDRDALGLNKNRVLDRILMKMLEKDPFNRISLEGLMEIIKNERTNIQEGKRVFIRKSEELLKIRKSRILEKDDDFIEFLKKKIVVSEVHSRVFQYSKAIEKSHEILQYVGSFLSINREKEVEDKIEMLQARVYENLGEIYKRNMQYQPSLFNFQEAVRILGKILNSRPQDRDLQDNLMKSSLNLASLLRFSGRTAESLSLLEKIQTELNQKLIQILNASNNIPLPDYKTSLSRIYQNFAEVYETFAGLLRMHKDSLSAIKSLEKALNYLEFSNKNEVLLINYQTIYAETLLEAKQFEKSRFLLEKILENSKRTSFYNENSGICLVLLAKICTKNHDYNLAEVRADQALEMHERLFKDHEKNKHFSEIYILKAKIAKKQEKFDVAEEFMRKAIKISKKIDDYIEILRIQWKISKILREKRDFKAEFNEIEIIYDFLQKNRENIGKNTEFHGKILQRLGEIYKKNGELDKSIIIYQEALGSIKKNEKREDTLIALCENMIEVQGIELKEKIEKIKEYYKEARVFDRGNKEIWRKDKLKEIKRFLERNKSTSFS